MDLIIYLAILVIAGFVRSIATKDVVETAGIVDSGGVSASIDTIPIGNNYALRRYQHSFMEIVVGLGLWRV